MTAKELKEFLNKINGNIELDFRIEDEHPEKKDMFKYLRIKSVEWNLDEERLVLKFDKEFDVFETHIVKRHK